MQSDYGHQTPPIASELTSVEPGSPMGELLRRYWPPSVRIVRWLSTEVTPATPFATVAA